MPNRKAQIWIAWSVMTLTMIAYGTYRLNGPDRTVFLPGRTSHGHYQIELDCAACHTPWMSVREDSCIRCHGEELKAANDSHPKNKFTDPRNADRLRLIRADNCVTCHREHVPEQTRAMGVTMPDDYCFHCHQETLDERPSHKGLAFDSCATAGCHNYHDNTALYEDFLLKHLADADHKDAASVPGRNLLQWLVESETRKAKPALTAADADPAPQVRAHPQHAAHIADWAGTAHAAAGVNCGDCHRVEVAGTSEMQWSDKLDHRACVRCHAAESNGFLAGRHGMRIAAGLSPMTPAMARLPMKPDAAHHELNCISCHGAHRFDTRRAAVEACAACHDDSHTRAYFDSPHHDLWRAELSGAGAAGSGVSCATCHLPRETRREDGVTRVLVQHNQNSNLRPNEKMARSVCGSCHGLAFTLDALADAVLVTTNFSGHASRRIESLDWAARRAGETPPNRNQRN